MTQRTSSEGLRYDEGLADKNKEFLKQKIKEVSFIGQAEETAMVYVGKVTAALGLDTTNLSTFEVSKANPRSCRMRSSDRRVEIDFGDNIKSVEIIVHRDEHDDVYFRCSIDGTNVQTSISLDDGTLFTSEEVEETVPQLKDEIENGHKKLEEALITSFISEGEQREVEVASESQISCLAEFLYSSGVSTQGIRDLQAVEPAEFSRTKMEAQIVLEGDGFVIYQTIDEEGELHIHVTFKASDGANAQYITAPSYGYLSWCGEDELCMNAFMAHERIPFDELYRKVTTDLCKVLAKVGE